MGRQEAPWRRCGKKVKEIDNIEMERLESCKIVKKIPHTKHNNTNIRTLKMKLEEHTGKRN